MKLINSILVIVILLAGCSPEKNKTVQIYPEKIISKNFIGNGVQWDAYPHADAPDAEWGALMTDSKWEMVYKRLDYMRPRLVRVMDMAYWRYLKGFDQKGEPIVDFDSPEIKSLQKLLDYCQKNNITVLFGEWGCPYPITNSGGKTTGYFAGANDPKWIEIIVKYLDNLINVKGYTCLKYYNLVNEPNGYWASTNGNWDEWSEGIKLLNTALKTAGLSDKISIAGPDVVAEYNNPDSKYTGFQWVDETTRQLDDAIGIYDIHAYTSYDLVRGGNFGSIYSNSAKLAKNLNKQIIFGELGFNKSTEENNQRIKTDKYASEDSQMSVYDFSYGNDMADVAIQIMNCGYSGTIAWALDDAMHTLGDKGDKSQLKRWGFWNSLGTELCNNPADENIRPWFYSWSLLSRYFPSGINIVESDSTGKDGLRLAAGTIDSEMTIAIVNNSDITQNINLASEDFPSKSFKKFIYSESLRPVDGDNFPVPQEKDIFIKSGKGMSLEIPAKSFVLYTTFDY
jgi:hypothetical protein